jgi:Asp-tRNA(Asn)/Glu-tRNA(Gln) amidotransferase A subunit family amidase
MPETSRELFGLNRKSESRGGCTDLATSFVERLENNSSLQNPWVTWSKDSKELAQEIYQGRNRPLAGIILGVKDVISTEKFQTKMGNDDAWKNPNMGFNARVVSIAKELGAVIGGKTKSSEFAVHQQTDVVNPKYPGQSAGTSSAGSAAAVANGTVEIALATQTAGSIARPSSYCGVVGFKPTFGDFPRTGVLKTTDDFDTVGFLGRNPSLMRDFYLLTRLSGPDYPLLETRRRDTSIKKITILIGEGFDSSEAETQELVGKYYEREIKKFGYQLIPKEEFIDFNQIRDTHKTIYRRDLAYYFETEISDGNISQELRDFIDLENLPSPSEYKEAKIMLSGWQKNCQQNFEKTLILSLASSTSAPIEDQAYEYDLNAAITAAGFPQLCIPAFNDSTNRNISLSLSSAKGGDREILELGIHLFENRD